MLNREEAALFSAKANSGQCSHAYIVDGAKGVGKLSFAIYCASAMLCVGEDKPCGECSHCRKIAGGDHPDLHIFGKEKSISIDDVREIIRRSSLKPNDSDKQIFILCGDSKLSSSVQNALLKIIEEPPETVALFILTESRSSLLPTVLSRGQRIHLDGLSDKEMTEKLKEAFPKSTFGDIYTAVDFARGNYGEAERFLSKESSAVRTKAEKIFQAAVTRESYDLMAALILPKYKRDQLIPILSEFIFMIAEGQKQKYGAKNNAPKSGNNLQNLKKASKRALAAMCEVAQLAIISLENNANVSITAAKLATDLLIAAAR